MLIGEGHPVPIGLKIVEFSGALLTGVGGGRILSSEVDKKLLKKEKQELYSTRDDLAEAIKDFLEES